MFGPDPAWLPHTQMLQYNSPSQGNRRLLEYRETFAWLYVVQKRARASLQPRTCPVLAQGLAGSQITS